MRRWGFTAAWNSHLTRKNQGWEDGGRTTVSSKPVWATDQDIILKIRNRAGEQLGKVLATRPNNLRRGRES